MKFRIALGWLLLASLAGAEDARLRGGNLLGCETYSFRSLIRAGKLDPLTVPELYRKLGIRGISYNDIFFKSFDDDYVDRVKAAAKKANRTIFCFVMEGNLVSAGEEQRRRQIEIDKQKLRVARRLGAPLVRVNIGNPGRQENASDAMVVERAVAAFKELLPLAQQLGIRMSIENHGGLSGKAENIVQIIQQTDAKWVGALLDFGNTPPASRYQDAAQMAPYALTTHVKNGEGDIVDVDIPRLLEILKKNRYKGPISIEYELNGDPVQGVQELKAVILKNW
ncbi:MAG TPA: sugar phosphate isomerase/epimerase family protein [Bryobacterales bacterium]|jgi:L-ribulose-5-phosphate 3-epimerase|nr:sugar phosphate isomerase/epimerase family protein [Bryobacterales bacterium]